MTIPGAAQVTGARLRRIVATLRVSLDGVVGTWQQGCPAHCAAHVRPVAEDVAEWDDTRVLGREVAAGLAELKRRPGSDIDVSGSITLTRSLLRIGLVDDLHLLMHPIVVGAGRRLFPADGERIPLALVEATRTCAGVVHLHYRPDRHGISPSLRLQRETSDRGR
ncbi:dihydrofolate reductase family protein [Embleya sp. NPDC008237]|uniref:dihydrofolate reductase family protein n=1 Tax=Embleya sp. NPDC008237 TaxID=3363978 RepID=UPI0036F02DCB